MRARCQLGRACLLVALVSTGPASAVPLTDLAVEVDPVEGGEQGEQTNADGEGGEDEGGQAEGGRREVAGGGDGVEEPPGDGETVELDKVVVVNEPDDYFTLGGSAHVVDEEKLEEFEHDDVHSVMTSVPGVYVRGEDGYGLRPNIGLRGANSDRSKKVTLMEDGILFGPAPYSAPAAYYFPIVTRMTKVEVIKGPSAIRYGPNTVGGAVNFRTREIPDGSGGGVDVAGGSNLYGKLHGYYGYGAEHWGLLAEGVHLRTNGFKDLDGGGDTGFRKNEFMVKGRLNTDPSKSSYSELAVKLGYSTEVSRETYLGLTDADFAGSPYRRYRASALDRMEWERTQAQLAYRLSVDEVDVELTVYRHDFTRAWRKFNTLADAAGRPISVFEVLRNPDAGRNRLFYDVLVGNETSEQDVTLRIGTNRRDFVSEGVQLVSRFETEGTVAHAAEYGVRFHHDEIVRRHTDDGFFMREVDGAPGLVSDMSPTTLTTHNRGATEAVAGFLIDEITWSRLTVAPGVRIELIRSRLQDRPLTDGAAVAPARASTQQALLPGVGLFYAITDTFGALAGVHRGFSPVSPGQVDDVRPETSVNYEAGLRLHQEWTQAEAIGFFNDYDNLTPECAFSQGCSEQDLDQQFAGGEFNVWGIETLLAHEARVKPWLSLPLRLSYTFTRTRALTPFVSANPQLAEVEEGDELPYVPRHQLSVQVGATGTFWATHLAVTHISSMREQAGQGELDDGETRTDASTILDLAGQLNVFEGGRVYAKVDNILGSAFIASRRPFGARPLRPRLFQLGFKYEF